VPAGNDGSKAGRCHVEIRGHRRAAIAGRSKRARTCRKRPSCPPSTTQRTENRHDPLPNDHPWIEEHPAAGSVSQTPTNWNAPAIPGVDLTVAGVIDAPPRRVSTANH
jgi:hypothetical protein